MLIASRTALESRFGTCTVKTFSMYVVSAAGNLILGLYDDDGPSGGPGTLIAQTGSFAAQAGWNTQPVLSEQNIAPGTYWICHHMNNASLSYGAVNPTPGGNEARAYSRTFATPLPATFSTTPATQEFRWSVYATLQSTSATYTTGTFPGTPTPIAGQGYSVAFQDHFDFYDRETWADHIFYDIPPPTDSIYCTSSVLHVNSRHSNTYPDLNLALARTFVDGTTEDFQYGYFEASMRWNYETGMLPAFWLSSTANGLNANWPATPDSPPCECTPCLNGEIDIVEAVFDDPQIIHGTLHKNTGDLYEGTADDTNSPSQYDTGINLNSSFHTYGLLWTSGAIRFYLDNSEILSMVPPWDSTKQSMFLVFSQLPNNSWEGNPASATNDMDLEVDWVRVWQQ